MLLNGFSLLNNTPDTMGGDIGQEITIVGVGGASGPSGIALPAGTLAGDLLICFMGYDSATLINGPTGFTAIESQLSTNQFAQKAAWKISTGSDSAENINWADAAILVSLRKASGTWTEPSSAAELHSFKTAAAPGTTLETNPVTPISTRDFLLCAFYNDENLALATPPPGMALVKDQNDSSFRNTVYSQTGLAISPVTKAVEWSGSDDRGCQAVIVHAE